MTKQIFKGVSEPVGLSANWFTIDPVEGCPYACKYCFLTPFGMTGVRPHNRGIDIKTLFNNLEELERSICLDINLPIAYGNHTDLCSTIGNRNLLLKILIEHYSRYTNTRFAVVSTKARLTADFLKKILETKVNIIFFISLAFNSQSVERGAPSISNRLKSIRLLSEAGVNFVHWWRPVTQENVPDIKTAIAIIQQVRSYGSQYSVVVEDKRKIRNQTTRLEYKIDNVVKNVLRAAREEDYPVFMNTNCALATIQQHQETSGMMRALHKLQCSESTCPSHQRNICIGYMDTHPLPSNKALDSVARYLNLSLSIINFDEITESIFIDANIQQSKQDIIEHALGFPVQAREVSQSRQWLENLRTK